MRPAGLIAPLLAAALALPAAGQEQCPWGGAVARVQDLDRDVYVDRFESETLFARVEGLPACDVTVAEVREAAARPECALYADRPDALGIEMVLDCLLEQTDGQPEDGTTVHVSSTATRILLEGG
jgi:hypothetical protein